jgi:hypothetical protein
MLTSPIDNLHAECMTAVFAIRQQVEELRAVIATWEPRSIPPRNADEFGTPHDIRYLDEIDRPKGWFRT